ncbi:MAG: hypothetical protein IJD63_02280 [Oscillospiraceae bacterium]|nr:hypothetical protein [Oscillospiraceae bacterium]
MVHLPFLAGIFDSGNLTRFLIFGVILTVGSAILGGVGRLVFGKRSLLGTCTSSAIAIVFLYALTAVLLSLGAKYARFTAPLPFVTVEGDVLTFFTFADKDFSAISVQLVNMLILAFVVNLADRFLPRGKNFFSWLLFRVLTVAFGLIAHLLVTILLGSLVPEGIAQYASTILLVVLGVMLLTGALKFIVGIALGALNPIIGALYTFFFANIIGKQLTRSALTTALLTVLVFGLERLGIASIGIALGSLLLYIPYGAGLLGLWYLCNKFF